MSYSINQYINTIEYKKELKREIEKLRREEHLEIFKIIKEKTNKYTENNNGIFINLKNLEADTLFRIGNFVKYCKENVEKLSKYESIKNNILNDNLLNVETTTNNINIEYNNYEIEEQVDCSENIIEDIKKLTENEETQINFRYPKILNKNPKLFGVGNRLIKKCKSLESDANNKNLNFVSYDDML
tara:strand:+ start:72 stop:629 length:558 start_codon:yes stop_codon:yes gene_type:complete